MKTQFTKEEFRYCCSQLNGVIPTISFKPGQEWESIRANILAGEEWEPLPPELESKLKQLTFLETIELYAQIKQFWDEI